MLNASMDISLAVYTGKTKSMRLGHHRGMMANEYFTLGRTSYEKWKPLNI